MEEPIRLDGKDKAVDVRPRRPRTLDDGAPVVLLRLADGRERSEIVRSDEWTRRSVEGMGLERLPKRPLEPLAKGRGCGLIAANHITVAARAGIAPSMESLASRPGSDHPHVLRRQRSERSRQLFRTPRPRQLEAHDLPECVDTGIRPPRRRAANRAAGDALERRFED
jgi:hypothetical protein